MIIHQIVPDQALIRSFSPSPVYVKCFKITNCLLGKKLTTMKTLLLMSFLQVLAVSGYDDAHFHCIPIAGQTLLT